LKHKDIIVRYGVVHGLYDRFKPFGCVFKRIQRNLLKKAGLELMPGSLI
jgi:hypothetical protein